MTRPFVAAIAAALVASGLCIELYESLAQERATHRESIRQARQSILLCTQAAEAARRVTP